MENTKQQIQYWAHMLDGCYEKDLMIEEAKLSLEIGKGGHLGPKQLEDPKELFADSYRKLDSFLASHQKIDIAKEFKDDIAYQVWLNYVRSMFGEIRYRPDGDVDRRGFNVKDKNQQFYKVARGFIGWMDSIRKGKIKRLMLGGRFPILAFKDGDAYLFGHWIDGIFIACYLSAPSAYGMLGLMKKLCIYDNVVFQVTLDMADMLERLGLFTDGKVHQAKYSGHQVDKRVFATSQSTLDKMLVWEKILQKIANK